jgi:UDP-N-acetylmuramoyl-tripeptide--D-alanyl-D-alanine ligase
VVRAVATPIPENRAPFSIEEIALATRGTIVARGANSSDANMTRGAGITSDSRAVKPGTLFVALKGESHDGHAFVDRAVAQGAIAIVVERGRSKEIGGASDATVSVIEVDDTLRAWGDVARDHLASWRKAPGRSVVAITGTAGKTTTKELTAALFAQLSPTVATQGNLNNRIGVPATIFTIEPAHVHAVIETGMSVRGEIAELGRIVVPDAGIVTNIGVGHAEGVGGTRADVAREKGALFESLAPEGIAIANADDDFVMKELARKGDRRAVTFGHSGDYALASRRTVERGQTIRFDTLDTLDARGAHEAAGKKLSREVTIPLPSEAQAFDLLAALAAVEALAQRRLEPAAIERAVRAVSMQGRLALVPLGDGTLLIDDTYNANPASMEAALRTLAEAAGKNRRKVAILGEMKELGPRAPEEHERLGDFLADCGIDLAIGCGGLVARTLARASSRGVPTLDAGSTDDACGVAEQRVKAGDVVLVKGSRSVRTERVVEALVRTRGRAEESG